MSLILGKRPSEILRLKGDTLWLFHFDSCLLEDELERFQAGKDETVAEKAERMRKYVKRRK
jgi:hypothetical protein